MSALDYERLVFHEARLPMRRGSLHDLLNLCMWCLWPRSKAALNALHVHRGWDGQERSAAGNAGTLLDECGVVVISTRPETETLNRQHQWNRLFVHQRNTWSDEIVALPLGHGLLEQLIKPYDGLMGKAVYLQRSSPLNISGQDSGPSSAPTPDPAVGLTTDLMTRLIALADGEIAVKIEQLSATRQLLPLPVLGIPGWHSHNTNPAYYRNHQYFRPAPSDHPVG